MRRLLYVYDWLTLRLQRGEHASCARNTLRMYGSLRCSHRSHRLRLPCLRYWTYDRYCGTHNGTCWGRCQS